MDGELAARERRRMKDSFEHYRRCERYSLRAPLHRLLGKETQRMLVGHTLQPALGPGCTGWREGGCFPSLTMPGPGTPPQT